MVEDSQTAKHTNIPSQKPVKSLACPKTNFGSLCSNGGGLDKIDKYCIISWQKKHKQTAHAMHPTPHKAHEKVITKEQMQGAEVQCHKFGPINTGFEIQRRRSIDQRIMFNLHTSISVALTNEGSSST